MGCRLPLSNNWSDDECNNTMFISVLFLAIIFGVHENLKYDLTENPHRL